MCENTHEIRTSRLGEKNGVLIQKKCTWSFICLEWITLSSTGCPCIPLCFSQLSNVKLGDALTHAVECRHHGIARILLEYAAKHHLLKGKMLPIIQEGDDFEDMSVRSRSMSRAPSE